MSCAGSIDKGAGRLGDPIPPATYAPGLLMSTPVPSQRRSPVPSIAALYNN